MPTTIAELALSASYRHAQRVLAVWLEHGNAVARRHVFAVRAALAVLDPTERDRLARWLAWLYVAASSRGESMLGKRIQRLDSAMHAAMNEALVRLPPSFGRMLAGGQRLSA